MLIILKAALPGLWKVIVMKHQNSCYSIVENLVEPVDLDLVSLVKPNLWVTYINQLSLIYIILGFDTELQVVNGKQYTDIKADDFSKFF